MDKREKTVCYVLAYKDPLFPRTLTLIKALKSSKHIRLVTATNSITNILRYFETILKLLVIHFRFKPDIYIVGFRGHEIFWIVRLLAHGKKVLFDSLVSPYGSLKHDEKKGLLGKIIAPLLYPLEKQILRHSDWILTDTFAQQKFFQDTFHLLPEKFITIFVGACESVQEKKNIHKSCKEDTLHVLFYGSFLPLHGVETILEAALLTQNKKVIYTLIGGHWKYIQKFMRKRQLREISNVRYLTWVPFKELLESYIPDADICLGGPFGGTKQSERVITTKTFQCISQGKPTVIGKNDATQMFTDKVNCLLVGQSNPRDLADAILWGKSHRNQLKKIGCNGRLLYKDTFAIKHITQHLEARIL